MKPTSLIFLALAAVLLFCGWFTCSIAESMADANGISIYEQKRNKKGDTVYVYNLSDEKIAKLILNFEDVDVTVIGSAKSSYVELKNFDPYDFSTKYTNARVTIDGTISGLSSFIDMSGGGLQFKGLRYLFANKPMKGHKKSVTLYISDTSTIKDMNLTIKNGDLTVKNVLNEDVVYEIKVTSGNTTFENVVTKSIIGATVKNGNITVSNTKVKTFNGKLTGGKLDFDMSNYSVEYLSYNVKAENSTLMYNGTEDTDGQLKIITSSDIQQCLIDITATDATITITDKSQQ